MDNNNAALERARIGAKIVKENVINHFVGEGTRAAECLFDLVEQFNRLDAKERKQTSTNKQNASKPRGQRVPDSEASARTLARRKAKAA